VDIARKKHSATIGPTRSVLKAVSILQCFSYDEPELSLSEIAHKVELPRTTVYRILCTLVNTGLLNRHKSNGKYRVGPKLYIMGSLYLATTDILSAAEPVAELINELTGESIKLSIFDRGNIVVIKKEETRHTFRHHHAVGSVLPAYASAMGKAFLSELSDFELDSLYPSEELKPLTGKTLATKAELKRELAQIRKSGVAFDEGGNTLGLCGAASLIRDATGKAVAAMCISTFPTHSLTEKQKHQFAELIKAGTKLISYNLGFRDRDDSFHSIEELRALWERIH
jgi:IclR family KDG regulon transcriptional repressor